MAYNIFGQAQNVEMIWNVIQRILEVVLVAMGGKHITIIQEWGAKILPA